MRSDEHAAVFEALANADRRRILDLVFESPGRSVASVAEHFHTSRIAVLRHVRVLEDAGLLQGEKRGRVRHLYFNTVPIQRIYDRWTERYAAFWAGRMVDLKERLEGRGVRKKGARHAG